MHREALICEEVVRAGEIAIIPVVKIMLTGIMLKNAVNCFAVKKPEYVVICLDGKQSAFNMAGEEIPVSRMKSEHPDLDDALSECCDSRSTPDC